MTGAQLQEPLDHTIFKRMEGHNHQKPTWRQGFFCAVKPHKQFVKFMIDGNAQRLKAARCGVRLPRFWTRQNALDDICKIKRAFKGLALTARHDGARNPPAGPFFTVGKKNIRQFHFAQLIYKVCRGGS